MLFSKQVFLRWADIDANYHVRHSVYYDFGAQHRIEILSESGLTLGLMQKQHFGPVLFREECVFKKEMRFDDTIFITTAIAGMKPDASRFKIRHLLSNEEKNFAVITVEGAWMNTQLRKLVNPVPKVVLDTLNAMPKTDDFESI